MSPSLRRLARAILDGLIIALCFGGVAKAAPIVAAVSAAVTFLAGTSIAAAVGRFVITLALSSLIQPKIKRPERQADVISLSIGEVAREAVFGRAAVGGSLVHAFNYGGKNNTDWEVLVIALADHPIDALEGFYIGENYYAYGANGLQAGFGNCLDLEFVNGSLNPTAPQRLATHGGWGATDQLVGITHIWVAYKYDAKIWSDGRPNFKFLVRGKRCYDPRKDSTVTGGAGTHRWADPATWEWTENAEICHYNWQRGIYAADQVASLDQLIIGRGFTEIEAPAANIFAAANICDELVPLLNGTTEARYRVGGVVSADDSFDVTEQQFAAAMGGEIIKPEGSVRIDPGVAKSVVAELTDEDLVVGEDLIFEPFLTLPERVNTVLARYVEPNQGWKNHSAPIRRSIAALQADGGAIEETLNLDLVTSGTQAQRIAEARLRSARLERHGNIVVPPTLSGIEEGDWIAWTSNRFHQGQRVVYRVLQWGVGPDWRNSLAIKEIATSVYGWTTANEIVPGAALPPPDVMPGDLALSGVAFSAQVLIGSDGTSIPAIRASWTTPVDTEILGVRIEVRVKGTAEASPTATNDPGSGVMIVTNGVAASAILQVRAIPLGGQERRATVGAWTDITVGGITAGGVAPGSVGPTAFGPGTLPVFVSPTAPTVFSPGQLWYNSSNGLYYNWNGTSWIPTFSAGSVSPGSIDLTKLASGITAIQIVSTLPASGTSGAVVFLTTDSKLYRWTGAAWTAVVNSSDLTGLITDAQIAQIAAAKIAGQLTDAQIAAIAAAKLTGQITETQIGSNSISTAKIQAAAIVSALLAADSVTAGKIAADSIGAREIAANSITAAEILAGTITAVQIAARTITAALIQAGAITANELAADSVIAGKIAAAAINAREIAAGAVTVEKLAVTARPITTPNLVFTASNGTLSWSSGFIGYTDNNGTAQGVAISAGSTTSTNAYVYWQAGANSLSVTTSLATAMGAANVLIGWYNGADTWYPERGQTLISGSFIQTNAIVARHIFVQDLSAINANLGTITAGLLRNAGATFAVNATLGVSVQFVGSYMYVSGAGFGASGNLIDWYGLTPSGASVADPKLSTLTIGNSRWARASDGLTYVGGAAIGTLATLNQVGTSNVATNAITKSATARSSGAVTFSTSWTDLQSVSISTDGGDVRVDWSTVLACSSVVGGSTLRVRVTRDGNTIMDNVMGKVPPPTRVPTSGFPGYSDIAGTSNNIASSFVIDPAPSAGSHTYAFAVQQVSDGTPGWSVVATAQERNMAVLELKR